MMQGNELPTFRTSLGQLNLRSGTPRTLIGMLGPAKPCTALCLNIDNYVPIDTAHVAISQNY